MHRAPRLYTWLLAGLFCAAGCGGGKGKSAVDGAAGAGVLGGAGGGAGTGGSHGADGGLVGCLDQPGALDRPPAGRLPCELIPPGLKL